MSKDEILIHAHVHALQLIPSSTCESVWACTIKDCNYTKSEPEDTGGGG